MRLLRVDGQVVLGAHRTYLMTSSVELPSGARLTGQGSSSVLKFTWRFNDADHEFAIRGAAPVSQFGGSPHLSGVS